MTASQRRTVMVTVAALGVAFVLVWAAAAGPPRLVSQPQGPVERSADARPAPVDESTADEQSYAGDEQQARTSSVGGWVRDLIVFALLLAAVFVSGLALRQLLLGLRRRFDDERLVVPLVPLPDLASGRAAVERDRARQREALAASDVRDGIVACWVVFEEAAAESHVVRQPAETASAFVVRFLHSLDVDPRPVGELARLFLEARFSTHPMADDARPRAERALAAIHQDLSHAGVAR